MVKKKLKFHIILYIKDRVDKTVKKFGKEQELEFEFPNGGSWGRQVLKPLDPERLEYAKKENAICKKHNKEILKGRSPLEISDEEYEKLRRLIPLEEPEPVIFEKDGKKYSILVKIGNIRKGLFGYHVGLQNFDISWELMDAEKYFALLERTGKKKDPNDKREKIKISKEKIELAFGPGYDRKAVCLIPNNTGFIIIGGVVTLVIGIIISFVIGKKKNKTWAQVNWTHVFLGVIIFLVLVFAGLWWWEKIYKAPRKPTSWSEEKNAFTG